MTGGPLDMTIMRCPKVGCQQILLIIVDPAAPPTAAELAEKIDGHACPYPNVDAVVPDSPAELTAGGAGG